MLERGGRGGGLESKGGCHLQTPEEGGVTSLSLAR